MSNSSIWPIDMTLLIATTPGQSGPGSDGNEGVLCIPRNSSITGALSSDYLMSYTGHSLTDSYPSVERQSVYSTAPVDWASDCVCVCVFTYICVYASVRIYVSVWVYR